MLTTGGEQGIRAINPARSPAAGWIGRGHPGTVLRHWLAQVPLLLWRMGLGRLLGRRLMVITTTGRTTGLPARVVAQFHTIGGRRYVLCPLGERAGWVQNALADPLVTIQTAAGVERASARRVTAAHELLAVYQHLRLRRPGLLSAYLRMVGVCANPADVAASRDRITVLVFEPTTASTPPPLRADLVWLWGALAALLILLLLSPGGRRRA